MLLENFHSLTAGWFRERFGEPTDAQSQGWPKILAGRHTLIAAPTGSGKTLAAFFVCLDRLVRRALVGDLPEGTEVVYISPLKALSNDIQRNLQGPLAELQTRARELGLGDLPIRVGVRTGDTPASERQAMLKHPPHILVTTPESLYLLLTSAKARDRLRTVTTVIVDEIHALARDKRGSHLTLTLERLAALCDRPPTRIGLSATQKPIEQIAEFLTGGVWRVASGVMSEKGEISPATNSQETTVEPTTLITPHAARITPPAIVNIGHLRKLDLALELPPTELQAVCSNEQWGEIYDRLVALIQQHRSTLIFVNTRRMAERVAHSLTNILGEEAVASHHGSLSKEIRLDAEQRLKAGQLKAIVATASLEMGIDIGYIDLVCQLGSPRSIANFLQRIGRSGHSLGATPKGRLFPLTRDELLECLALIRAVKCGRLDQIEIPQQPLDILAQQIVAAAACDEWDETDLYNLCRGAWPYRNLARGEFDEVIKLLSEGIKPGSKAGAYLLRDQINGRIKARRHARIAAITSGGAIPELGEYRVLLEGEGTLVGTVDEDFAIDSMPGNIFLLGNTSWRIQQITRDSVIVSDAHGQPPNIPFWFGEAPGRTVELSEELSTLRREIASRVGSGEWGVGSGERGVGSGERGGAGRRLGLCPDPAPQKAFAYQKGEACYREGEAPAEPGLHVNAAISEFSANLGLAAGAGSAGASPSQAGASRYQAGANPASGSGQSPNLRDTDSVAWLIRECNADAFAAEQAVRYVAAQVAAVGMVPTSDNILFERFFDESGGMQLVIHSPLGARINRAWGLALRKRFCRSFDFELQAAADDNGVLLSIGPQHSFPIDSLFGMLQPSNGPHLLQQALLAAPMFGIRWRWNVTRALAVLRMQSGKKVPPFLQKFRAEDLLAAAFPETVGCLENHHGDVEIPNHPLVRQTMHDCLTDAMDLPRWVQLLSDIKEKRITLTPIDTREPSPFSHQLLNARPYAFLDDAPLEERRTRAITTRRGLAPDDVQDLAKLDPAAIAQVAEEAWPLARDPDETHDALLSLILAAEHEAAEWKPWLVELAKLGRAARVTIASGARFWIAAERWPLVQSVYPGATAEPQVQLPPHLIQQIEPAAGRVELLRGRMQACGPITATELAARFHLTPSQAFSALEAIEGKGAVLRGKFTPTAWEAATNGAKGDLHETVEWCDRRLLARIHRLTLDGLRRRIQPVAPEVFLDFLTHWHGLTGERQRQGEVGVRETVAQLQGFEAPAGVWESKILAARIGDYQPSQLDHLFLGGEAAWGRLDPPERETPATAAAMTRAMPLSLALREDLPWLLPPSRLGLRPDQAAAFLREGEAPAEPGLRSNSAISGEIANQRALTGFGSAGASPSRTGANPSPRSGQSPNLQEIPLTGTARDVLSILQQRGALFFSDLKARATLLPQHLEEALRELAAMGLVTCDTFSAVRSLAGAKPSKIRGWRGPPKPSTPAGRWSLFPGEIEPVENDARLERWCRLLLARYGVVFRDVLARESAAPKWYELARVYRRMELRGQVRGGRFVSGVAGEQFALEPAITKLRQLRDEPAGDWVLISAADPLNFSGQIGAGPRISAVHTSAMVMQQGRCVASKVSGRIEFHAEIDPLVQLAMRRALQIGRKEPAGESPGTRGPRSKPDQPTAETARPTGRKLFGW